MNAPVLDPILAPDFFQHVINSIADPIFVKDRQHRWIVLNDAFCQLMGHSRETLIGKADHDFFPKEEADIFHDKDERVFFTGQQNVNEEAFTDAAGVTHTIITKKTLYRDREGVPYIVGVIRDITEQKKAEDQMKALNATLELRVSQRTALMEEKTEELAKSNADLERFAYVASHDLQEPLRMVASYVQLLARRYKGKLGTDADEFIGYAVDGVTRMKALINDLLDYSRIGRQQLDPKPTDSDYVVQQILAMMKLSIQDARATITRDSLPIISCDPIQLGQLFQNLIGNALKFHGNKPPKIRIAAREQDNFVIFSVADNGIGIDPQHGERIFDIFQRLHSVDKYPGTGIGLAVCKKIVERHFGRIWVESEPGKGTTFFFSMPKEAPSR
jgi:PAS domain S-box-containing protein